MQHLVSKRVRSNSWLIAMILCINTFKILGIFITIPYNIVLMEMVLMVFLAVLNADHTHEKILWHRILRMSPLWPDTGTGIQGLL